MRTKFLYCSIKVEYYIKPGRVKINTICLPLHAMPGEKWEDQEVTVAGWGYKDILRKSQLHSDSSKEEGEGINKVCKTIEQ